MKTSGIDASVATAVIAIASAFCIPASAGIHVGLGAADEHHGERAPAGTIA
ncbi:MAG: hypothetical protein M3Q42_12695 [Pseudomonadota bacterium]|nr:hypothetical protein [Pseudomonadota bacterium]